jgi:hypothetical protein
VSLKKYALLPGLPECESLAALQMQELEIKDEGKTSSRKPLRINAEHEPNNRGRVYPLSNKIATRLFDIVDRFEGIWKPEAETITPRNHMAG